MATKKPRKGIRANNDNKPGSRVGFGGGVLSHAGKYSKTGVAIQPAGGTIQFVGGDGRYGGAANKNARRTGRKKR